MVRFLVWVRVNVKIRVRVRVGVTFNVSIYHWSNCRRRKCRTFFREDFKIKCFSLGLFSLYIIKRLYAGIKHQVTAFF